MTYRRFLLNWVSALAMGVYQNEMAGPEQRDRGIRRAARFAVLVHTRMIA